MSLLQQSYDISQQLPLPVRLNLLVSQAQIAVQFRLDVGRLWVDELFTLSSQMKGRQRSAAQNAAARMLVRLDPHRALELLHSLKIEDPSPKWAPSPPEMQVIQDAFLALIERDGESALPLLQQEAERIGKQGRYPYGALGYATMQSTTKYWGNDNQRAIQILQSVFDPAFARYRQNPRSYFDDIEFGNMLGVLAGGLPFDSVQPALHMLVRNLLTTNTRDYQFEAQVYTSDGKVAKAHNAIDAAILYFGMLVNRDPELAQELESSRPELQTALAYAKGGRQRSSSFGPSWQPRNMQSHNPDAEARMDAMHVSFSDPDAAIAKAERLPPEERQNAMLDIARNIAGDYPGRAAELIARTQTGNKPANNETNVNLISAEAFIAVAHSKKDALQELLQRGFESANRVMLEQQRTGDIHFFTGLGPLVQVGIENAPDLTIDFIAGLSPSYVKAQLLLTAASDLGAGAHVPRRFHPQEVVEQSAQ